MGSRISKGVKSKLQYKVMVANSLNKTTHTRVVNHSLYFHSSTSNLGKVKNKELGKAKFKEPKLTSSLQELQKDYYLFKKSNKIKNKNNEELLI